MNILKKLPEMDGWVLYHFEIISHGYTELEFPFSVLPCIRGPLLCPYCSYIQSEIGYRIQASNAKLQGSFFSFFNFLNIPGFLQAHHPGIFLILLSPPVLDNVSQSIFPVYLSIKISGLH